MAFSPLTIELAWPSPDLSPNSRVHFMVRSRAAKKAREEAFWSTRYVKPLDWSHDGSRLRVALEVRPPDKRHYDLDGILSRCKSALDGIADALSVNDRLFDPAIRLSEPVRNGRVVVTIGGGE